MSQKTRATLNKKKSERRIVIKLTPWIQDIVANYRIGDVTASESSVPILKGALKSSFYQAGKDVMTFDVREFKQANNELRDEIYRDISRKLDAQYEIKSTSSTFQSSRTASKLTARTTQLAIENEWTQREADIALGNYLKGQRLTIASTNSQWVVEATRNTAVVSVKDPLTNTIERIVMLIENDDINGATRLSRQVSKLTKLPTSVNQGKLIRTISDARDSLTSPIVQGETIASLRKQGARLQKSEKEWQTLGDSDVRDTHQDVNGQIRDLEAPFNLPGGDMQYPGDGSLGASLSEIIKCRCSTVYI